MKTKKTKLPFEVRLKSLTKRGRNLLRRIAKTDLRMLSPNLWFPNEAEYFIGLTEKK